jgi:SAM-dependent methyltransferase
MDRLADKTYWDGIYGSRSTAKSNRPASRAQGKSILSNGILRSYADCLLWDAILPKYLPRQRDIKVLEVGSAPGHNLVRLHQTFGYFPYGVDYSDSGVRINREVFEQHNLPKENVIHADFLSEEFHSRFKGFFEIVSSAGFIEHFNDVVPIIEGHLDLLAPGGYLVVSVPNLRGLNGSLQRFFDKSLLPIHNLHIMEKSCFSKLFERDDLIPLFCNYYGLFNFNLFIAKKGSIRWFLLAFCKVQQLLLNLVFRLLFGKRGCESKTFSPYLLFIGVKKTPVSG